MSSSMRHESSDLYASSNICVICHSAHRPKQALVAVGGATTHRKPSEALLAARVRGTHLAGFLRLAHAGGGTREYSGERTLPAFCGSLMPTKSSLETSFANGNPFSSTACAQPARAAVARLSVL